LLILLDKGDEKYAIMFSTNISEFSKNILVLKYIPQSMSLRDILDEVLSYPNMSADAEKEKHVIKEEEMKSAAAISDLENWSEYKVRRLVEETSMN
jgi:hypothetical protein